MTMGRHAKTYTDSQLARRNRVEAELSAIPAIPAAARKLTSLEGFIDYYLDMRDLYQSYLDAYKRLEEFYVAVTGHRRYSEFDSFRRTLRRYRYICPTLSSQAIATAMIIVDIASMFR